MPPTLTLPAGWCRVESASHPGEYYYSGPGGSTWTHPVTGVADCVSHVCQGSAPSPRSPAKVRHFGHTSTYRNDFTELDSTDAKVERLDRITMYNPSNAPHPKARPSTCNFNSLSRTDYKRRADFVPEPPAHQWTIPVPIAPMKDTTTYRAEYVPRKTEHQPHRRHVTPPRQSKFVFTSTQRASYSPRAAGAAKELPQASPQAATAAKEHAPLTSDITTFTFNDAAHRLPQPPSTRRPRHSSVSNNNIFAGVTTSARPATSTYRGDFVQTAEQPRNHRLEARDHAYLPWRCGQNKAVDGQFDTLYSQSYTDEFSRGTMPALLKTCRAVDAQVLKRSKEQRHEIIEE